MPGNTTPDTVHGNDNKYPGTKCLVHDNDTRVHGKAVSCAVGYLTIGCIPGKRFVLCTSKYAVYRCDGILILAHLNVRADGVLHRLGEDGGRGHDHLGVAGKLSSVIQNLDLSYTRHSTRPTETRLTKKTHIRHVTYEVGPRYLGHILLHKAYCST